MTTMQARIARLRMLSAALTQFIENSNDEEDRCKDERSEVEFAEAELELVNEELVDILG